MRDDDVKQQGQMGLLPKRIAHRAIVIILVPLLLAACTSSEQSSSADLGLGKIVYEANCAACHGTQGEGQPNWKQPGPDGKLLAPPHDSTGHTWHHPDGLLLEIIAQGGGSPNSNMPAYADILTQAEMEAALAYIKTFWRARDLEFQTQVTNQNEAP